MNATTVAPWKKTRDLCILLDSFCLPFLNAIKPAPNDATVQANTVYVIIKTEIRPSGSKAVGVMVVVMTTATMMMTSSEPKRKSVSIKTLNMEKCDGRTTTGRRLQKKDKRDIRAARDTKRTITYTRAPVDFPSLVYASFPWRDATGRVQRSS